MLAIGFAGSLANSAGSMPAERCVCGDWMTARGRRLSRSRRPCAVDWALAATLATINALVWIRASI